MAFQMKFIKRLTHIKNLYTDCNAVHMIMFFIFTSCCSTSINTHKTVMAVSFPFHTIPTHLHLQSEDMKGFDCGCCIVLLH